MTEYDIIRGLLLRHIKTLPARHTMAKDLLEWARKHGGWLFGLKRTELEKLNWTALRKAVRSEHKPRAKLPAQLGVAQELARMLALNETDTAIVNAIVACDRLRRCCELTDVLGKFEKNLPELIGEAAGLPLEECERLVRQHPLARFGLFWFKATWRGGMELHLSWQFERLLDRAPDCEEAITELMVGPKQTATLPFEEFRHVQGGDFLQRLLAGAVRENAAGINILIHGPPGTGKTEFSRSLAAAAGLNLHGVGEADEDGEEPTRWDRISALQLGYRLLGDAPDSALLFDEMEDMIGDAKRGDDDRISGRKGSKVFVNRLLETNPLPVIWTSNAVANVDSAILRRMSYVLEMDYPSRGTAMRMMDRIGSEEHIVPGAGFSALIDAAPETATVLRVAAKAGRLAGEDDGGVASATSLVSALREERLDPAAKSDIDLSLYETDIPIDPLMARMRDGGASDISMLLTGPPGTGKTALAHHMAKTLDRPLIVKRTSDLLSKWVGQTEKQIADAFYEARQREGVLLFDEVDSLLFDRSDARTSWEVSQVNELLTWLDKHPLPVVAATNHARKLDPATMRRFVFKMELRALSGEKLSSAFERFFAMEAPRTLQAIGNLTPGDFALVARQLRHAPVTDSQEIVARLKLEADAKPDVSGRMGF
ncbi:AAA family ATPase [Pontixanthobacter sp. CEM42]|uniref:AAA family ATPase n=1 Tax=Pontixanthobacter sp. CEM42 TaxID=2792077 RepID=UPI001ADFE658|nr:AAA family ATPase [Pontixanthobacter sp. CEM42]